MILAMIFFFSQPVYFIHMHRLYRFIMLPAYRYFHAAPEAYRISLYFLYMMETCYKPLMCIYETVMVESLIYLAKCLIAYVLSIFKMKYALVSAFFDIDYFLQIDCHIVAAYFYIQITLLCFLCISAIVYRNLCPVYCPFTSVYFIGFIIYPTAST